MDGAGFDFLLRRCLTVAILAALWHRQRTGEGQYIDQSQWESAIAVLPEGIMAQVMNGVQPERMGNRSPVMAPHGTFRCAGDDLWVSIACGSDEEFAALCRVMERPDLAGDPRFATVNERLIEASEGNLNARREDFQRGVSSEDEVANAQLNVYDNRLMAFSSRQDYYNQVTAFLGTIAEDPVLKNIPAK